jgi:predicted nucleic acid-binding Zn finger protein
LAVFTDELETCSCPDYQRHKQPCKHVYAATVYRSKSREAARRAQAARTQARASRASLAPLAAAL